MIKHVLLIEDEPDQAYIIGKLLKSTCILEHASSSLEAFKKASSYKYDLVLLDIGLWDISGLQIASTLRLGERYRYTPIIAYSSYWDCDEATLRKAGIDEFIRRPFKDPDLNERITYWLGRVASPKGDEPTHSATCDEISS